jgi:hypothetical protein
VVVIRPDAPTVIVRTVFDGDVAGGCRLPCAQCPLPSGKVYGFNRATSLLGGYDPHIFIYFCIPQIHKRQTCWIENKSQMVTVELTKYYFQV